MRRVLIALTLSLALGACGQVVSAPPADVINQLRLMPPEANVMHLAQQVPHLAYRTVRSDQGVDWIFAIDRKDICKFSAIVTESGEGKSRVTTAIEQMGEQKESYLCNIAQITGEESVAATLQGRAANVEAVSAKVNQYLLSNMGEAMDMVSRRMDEMAPPAGHECESGDADARSRCRQFMRARAQEMKEQGFANP